MTVQQAPITNNQLWDRLAGGPGQSMVQFCDDATLARLTRVCSAWHSQSVVTKAVAERQQEIEQLFHPDMVALFNRLNIKIGKLPYRKLGQFPVTAYPIARCREFCYSPESLFFIRADLENRINGKSEGEITFTMWNGELTCIYRKWSIAWDGRKVCSMNSLTTDAVGTILSGQHGILRLGRAEQLDNTSHASFLAAVITAAAFGLNWLLQGY